MTTRKTGKLIARPLATAIASLFAVCEAVAATVLYVKPGGTGAGTSWSDAADLEAAVATATSGGGEYDLYLAQGIYYPAATVKLADGISLYGSFPGLSDDETLEVRSVENTPSIISGDVDKNDYWEKYDANDGTVTAQSSWPVIANGAISVPADLGDYVTVVPASASVQDNLVRLLTILPGAACTLDGVVLQGGGRGETNDDTVEDGYALNHGGSLLVGDGAKATVRGCRVVGSCARETAVFFGGTAAQPSISLVDGSRVEHCRGGRMAAVGMSANASATLTNCTFYGNARYHKYAYAIEESAAAIKAGDKLQLHDCLFERNVVIKTWGEWSNASTVLALPYCGSLRANPDALRGLKFVANACWSGGTKYGHPLPLVGFGIDRYRLNGWTIERNMIKSSAPNPKRCSLVGGPNACTFTLENSSVFSNKLDVTADATSEEAFVAPVVSRGLSQFVNCTFFDNDVSETAPGTCATYASRAVLGSKHSEDTTDALRCVSCFNCTFSGSTPLPDVVDGGVDNSRTCSFVANSILWATGAAANTPRAVAYGNGTGNAVELANCIVRSPELLAPRVWKSGPVSGEDPLLEPMRFVATGDRVPTMRCGALTPAMRQSFDVKEKTWNAIHVIAYFPGGSTTGGKSRDGNGTGGTSTFVRDALGNERPSGAFTLGAVQSAAPAAEAGVTVVYRARPAKSGTVDGANVMKTQVYGVGEVAAASTAAATMGNAFNSWRDESGAVLSTSAAYAPSTSAAGSFYADAWFTPETASVTVSPGDDLQDALDSLALRGGAVTLNLSAGTYRVAATLKSASESLTIVGGGEAVLTGDQTGQAYWQKADGTAVTDGSGKVLHVFDGGVFNEPNATREDFYWKPVAVAPTTKTLFDVRTTRTDEGAGIQLVFDGVTFALGAVNIGRAESTFRDCRILACPNGADQPVVTCWTNIVLTGTEFVGNFALPVTDTDNKIGKYTCKWVVSNCVFKANVGGSYQRGPAISQRNADLDVFDTAFLKNATYFQGLYYGSLVIGTDYSKIRLIGCEISENVFSNTPAIVMFPYAAHGIASNCRFRANRVVGDVGTQSAEVHGAIVYSHNGGATLYNTTFLSNEVDYARAEVKDGSTNGYACVVYGHYSVGFVNCHLEGNRTRYAGPEGQEDFHAYSCTVYQGGGLRFPFVGTSFFENDFLDGEVFVNRQSTSYGLYFVNSIFWGTSAGYTPLAWNNTTKNYLDFYNCIIKNAPAAGGTGSTGVVHEYISCTDNDPKFGALTERDGHFYRPIGRDGGARRKGASVGVTADGILCFRKTDGKWYQCAQPWTVATFADYMGDMFGALPKNSHRPDLGPVQNTVPPTGVMFIVW